MISDHYLTRGWNNALTLGLGLPTVIFAGAVLATSAFSDSTAFIGILLIGAVY